jgi:hypothetical protein
VSNRIRIPSTQVLCTLLLIVACSDGENANTATTAAATGQKSAAPASIDACALLTGAEVEAAVGWKVAKTVPMTHTTGCNYMHENELENVAVIVSSGMQTMSNSEQMAEWRTAQAKGKSYSDIKFVINPINDLGVPAIENRIEGMTGMVGVESYVRGRLLTLTATSLEASKTLSRAAIARLP